ncbi:MAG TPA: TolC family protein [Candidatus Krumholzibacteria bacterium]
MKTPKNLTALLLLVFAVASRGAEVAPKKSLAECIAIALANQPNLKAAQAVVEAGQERTWQAVSTALPQVTANYAANRRNTSASARTGAADGSQSFNQSQTFDFYSTGVSLSQILFDFGQSLDAIRAARAIERSLQADEATTRETVLFDAKQAYFSLLTAKRLLAVAEENIRQNRKHLDLAEGRLDVGLATRFDVTQAQVQLANAELAEVTARNNVAVARATLLNALGLDGPLEFDIVDTMDIHDLHMEEQRALDLAYEHRPELLSQRLKEESQEQQIAALQKNYLPNVTGDAAYAFSGQDYPLQSSWNVGASVNLSVFNGGLTTAQIGEAKATLATLKYQERALRQQIALQVRQAVLNLAQALESIRVSQKGLQQARENIDLAEGRYTAGVGNIIELTDAQALLTTAEGNNVQALSNYKTALAALEQATAQSFEEETAVAGVAP